MTRITVGAWILVSCAEAASYTTTISENDRFSSAGQRLRKVTEILRQDRANVHVLKRADAGDEVDAFFGDKAARASLERARVVVSPGLENMILGTGALQVVVTVKVDAQNSLVVTLQEPSAAFAPASQSGMAGRVRLQYRTTLGPNDFRNSKGANLTKWSEVLAQDRANVNSFNRADAGDEPDTLFTSPDVRLKLQQMEVAVSPNVQEELASGRPLRVEVSVLFDGTVSVVSASSASVNETLTSKMSEDAELEQLDKAVADLMSQGRWAEALPQAVTQVELARKKRGTSHEATAIAEVTLSLVQKQLGQMEAAVKSARESASTMERSEALRPASAYGASPYVHCAMIMMEHPEHQDKASYGEALKWFKHAAVLLDRNPESSVGRFHHQWVECLLKLEQPQEALNVLQSSLKKLAVSEDTALLHGEMLVQKGQIYTMLDRRQEAAGSFLLARDALAAAAKKDPQQPAILWVQIGFGLMKCGKVEEGLAELDYIWRAVRKAQGRGTEAANVLALTILNEVGDLGDKLMKEIVEDLLADFSECRSTADLEEVMKGLCDLACHQGDAALARRSATRRLEALRTLALMKTGPQMDEAQAIAFNDMVEIEIRLGNPSVADTLYLEAIAAEEKRGEPGRMMLAFLQSGYGHVLEGRGRWSDAELHLRRSLTTAEALIERHGQPAKNLVLDAMSDLCLLRKHLGDYVSAAEFSGRAVALAKAHFADEPGCVATMLNNHALALNSLGQGAKSLDLFQEALDLENSRTPVDKAAKAIIISNIGLLKLAKGPEAAMPHFKEALDLVDADLNQLPPRNHTVAFYAHNLAWCLEKTGKPAEAAKLYAACAKVYATAMGPDHRDVGVALTRLGMVQLQLGDRSAALASLRKALDVAEGTIHEIFSFTSEDERLGYQPNVPYELLFALGDGTSVCRSLLRFKGIVLDSVLEDRLVMQKSSQADEFNRLSRRVAELRGERDRQALELDSTKKNQTRLDNIAAELQRLEVQIARMTSSTRTSLTVEPAQVLERMPEASCLLDYLEEGGRYGVCVTAKGGSMDWLDLGEEEDVKKKVNALRGRIMLSQECRQEARDLFDLLVAPVMKICPETRILYVCPDGVLHHLPFAMLVDAADRALVETHEVAYVTSGRDLLRDGYQKAGKTALLLCDPDFTAQSRAVAVATAGPLAAPFASPLTGTSKRDAGWMLERLPGTAAEGRALSTLLGGQGWQVELLEQRNASEAAYAGAQAVDLLHIATHGMILTEDSDAGAENGAAFRGGLRSSNPLRLGMLALSGAQTTLDQWRQGLRLETSNDGWLFASEIATLPLTKHPLVVLSACDTGLGQVKEGEGVLGLRRSFLTAGASSVVATLWSIPDAETELLMTAFYGRMAVGQTPRQALNSAQRVLFAKWRADGNIGLSGAINRAGAFTIHIHGVE